MNISIASDHAGFEQKQALVDYLAAQGHDVIDRGPDTDDRVDYPDYAELVARDVAGGAAERGVLVCGTGIGMSLAANRHPGIRAALCTTELHARFGRRHNNANVLCLGARVTGVELALAIVGTFLENQFEGGRHQRRLDLLKVPV